MIIKQGKCISPKQPVIFKEKNDLPRGRDSNPHMYIVPGLGGGGCRWLPQPGAGSSSGVVGLLQFPSLRALEPPRPGDHCAIVYNTRPIKYHLAHVHVYLCTTTRYSCVHVYIHCMYIQHLLHCIDTCKCI